MSKVNIASLTSSGEFGVNPSRTVNTISVAAGKAVRLSLKNSLIIRLILFRLTACLTPWTLMPSLLFSRAFGMQIKLQFFPRNRLPRR